MFDSLADQIRADEKKEGTSTEQRVIRWALVTVISLVVFGGLYLGVRFLE
jgi:hypothetical protein